MDWKIGEIFEYKGEWYQCLEEKTCTCFGCDFRNYNCDDISLKEVKGSCQSERRKDNKSVIFKKLEKVGEPFTSVEKLYQHYKVFDIDNVYGDVFWCVHNYKAKTLTIEIKQNQENMEEKETDFIEKIYRLCERYNISHGMRYDFVSEVKEIIKEGKSVDGEKLNLKPFDLEKAKDGKPVCTRDGRKARIICFDSNGGRPIVALITECDNEEEIPYKYHCDGSYNCESIPSDNDLMMLPEKKEGWINVKKDASLFKSREEAERNCTKDYVPVRVEFEI